MSESEYYAPDAERVFRVAKGTHPRDLGAMVAQVLFTDAHRVVLRAVGASAVNQAVKAVAVANWHLAKASRACCFIPQFESSDEDMTAMRLLVEERTTHATGEPL